MKMVLSIYQSLNSAYKLAPKVSISHWEISPESGDVVKKMYDYMNKIFIDALNFVENETLSRR